MGAKKPGYRRFYSKVAGVSQGNRQSLICKRCVAGDTLRLRQEPWNRHSKHAVAVSIFVEGWLLPGRWKQLGYLPEDMDGRPVAKEVDQLVNAGWIPEASIQVHRVLRRAK